MREVWLDEFPDRVAEADQWSRERGFAKRALIPTDDERKQCRELADWLEELHFPAPYNSDRQAIAVAILRQVAGPS